ncbi:MarR family transcriptional regulator [Corynebacterium mendelii]|uniref:MarR family transcriptional regulator n=1 Tax=Corynebacterium mendelii TaxID=2765362 RepID=A0A939IXA5_9CORY|nr:MarR family transcriptional regulator [Corynebacterium mendelii]MBN9643477.1 MarR family transcriptional regulator [Corynebacterium mendelii]
MAVFALHIRYRGDTPRRAEFVSRSAEALSTLDGVGSFEHLDVENIRALVATPRAVVDTTMVLLSDGDWAVGIGHGASAETAVAKATSCLTKKAKPGTVAAAVDAAGGVGPADIVAVFMLIAQILTRRTPEGREATSFMRRGYSQIEAAEELGISKQAMSQRLQAAAWQAENAGWQLAVNLLTRLDEATASPPPR